MNTALALTLALFLLGSSAGFSGHARAAATPGADGVRDGPPPRVTCTGVADSAEQLYRALRRPQPGTTICLAPGTYRDVELNVHALADATAPFTVAAQKAGTVILTGRTRIRMSGRHVVVQGLRIERAASAGNQLVEFRSRDGACESCRLTEITIMNTDAGSPDTKWVALYGRANRVDHSAFSGKTNPGALLVVWRMPGLEDHHRIDRNLFANRPPLGANGAEAIRIGNSPSHQSDSRTVVEYNLFDNWDGEIEIISSKSGANVFRHNTFLRSAGMLTLRHGDGATVEGNVFLTGGKPGAGGIRIVGARHRVVNNYIEGVRPRSPARGGIVLLASEPDPPAGGYQPVRDIVVANNTIAYSEQSFLFGAGRGSVSPERVELTANAVIGARGLPVRVILLLLNSRLADNVVDGVALGNPIDGFHVANLRAQRDASGILRPALEGVGITADIRIQPLTRADVGPMSYSPGVP